MTTFLIALVVIAFGWISYSKPSLGLAILVGVLPSYLIRFSILSLPFTLLEVLLLVFVVLRFAAERKKIRELIDKTPFKTIFLLAPIAAIATMVSPEPLAALGILKAYILEPLLLYFFIIPLLKEKETLSLVIRSLAFSLIISSLFAFFQWFNPAWIPIPWDIEKRVTGFFPYPNAFGLFAGPLVAFGAALLFHPKRHEFLSAFEQKLWLVASILGTLGIILAKSEASLFALFVILTLLGLSKKRTRIPTAGFLILISSIVFFMPTLQKTAQQKIFFQDPSEQVRLIQWQETWEMIKDKPVFGSGLSGYRTAIIPYHTQTHIEIFQYPHTLILNVWTELGILGVLFLIAVFFILSKSFLNNKTAWENPVYIAAVAALFHMIIHGMVDVSFFKNDLAILTIILIATIGSFSYVPFKQNVPKNSNTQN